LTLASYIKLYSEVKLAIQYYFPKEKEVGFFFPFAFQKKKKSFKISNLSLIIVFEGGFS